MNKSKNTKNKKVKNKMGKEKIEKIRFEKFLHQEILNFSAENTRKETQAIDTHEDILEISLRGSIDFNITGAAAEAIISIYQFLENLQLTVGSVKIWDLDKQQIQFVNAFWNPQNYGHEHGSRVSLVPNAVANNQIVNFDITLPCFVPKNTSNLKLKLKVGEFDEVWDADATPSVHVFNSMSLQVVPRYMSLGKVDEYEKRKGTFRIENSLYDVSSSGQKTVDFREGYYLDGVIVYIADNNSTIANRTYLTHLDDNIDKIQIKHLGDIIIDVFGEMNIILAQELGINFQDFRKTHDAVIYTHVTPYVYFLNIDDLPVTSNTKMEIDYNASAAVTDQLNVIFFYYK